MKWLGLLCVSAGLLSFPLSAQTINGVTGQTVAGISDFLCPLAGGTANAQTVTYTSPTYSSTTPDGAMVCFRPVATNSAGTTLSVNGSTATAIQIDGAVLTGSALLLNQPVWVVWNGTSVIWRCLTCATAQISGSVYTGVTGTGSTLVASVSPTFTGAVKIPGTISGGTKFTTSGCSISSTTGGAAAGVFTLGANSCSVVITINGATGTTAPNGWHCSVNDRTAPTVLLGGESSSTTATATIAIPVTAGATDVVSFSCDGY